MNHTANEILDFYDNADNEDILIHYGMPRRSGRYPWGSGDDPYQHGSRDVLGRYAELKKKGLKESEIAAELGLFNERGEPSSTKLRNELALAKDERRLLQIETAKRLRDKEGMGATAIGKEMGLPESTVRSLLNADAEANTRLARNTADHIRNLIKEKGMIEVGAGVEVELGISRNKLDEALLILEKEGYPIYGGRFQQATNAGQWTTQKVICPPGTQHKEIYDLDKIHSLNEDNYVAVDGGNSFRKFQYPASMDSKRLMVRYKEDGGEDKDGIVELRRGVDDLSLGDAKYSQVRILVDGKKYIKGMAVYSDDMPDGVDVIFNTNKSNKVPKLDVLKDIHTEDPDNPFGSLIKAGGQSTYIDKNGKEKLSLINKRADEGDWDDWKDALPSQFLSKQSLYMAKKQLALARADKEAQFDEICSLNNPTVKKHFLNEFASKCDSAAENLQAAALPGQKYHVIIPVNTLKDNEVYAPKYPNGSQVALVRYPHAGTFEIPILTVNNKHAAAKKLIGTDPLDAVCINKSNADRLSGADFDGDTVMVLPTNDKHGRVKITSTHELKDLKGFDPKAEYPEREGMRYMSKKYQQQQMGIVSNLITDMTLADATESEMAAAVRHSMVVIDAAKHKLDYKKSEADNNIAGLKKKYQTHDDGTTGGASTIISRAKGQYSVDKRQGSPYTNIKGQKGYDPNRPEGALVYKTADDLYKPIRNVNKKTGEITLTTNDGKKVKYDPSDKAASELYKPVKKVDKDTGTTTYTNKDGSITYKLEKRTQKSTQMAETDDAHTLVSSAKHPMEIVYANHANSMKAMANAARLEIHKTKDVPYSSTAKETYRAEYDSLMGKLRDAELNRPRERAANRQANAVAAAKQKAYYEETGTKMEASQVKKIKQQALTSARDSVGAVSRRERSIKITDREWDAIQAGAISKTQLQKILNNSDASELKKRAMPKANSSLSTAQVNKIKRMRDSNFTIEQIASSMGIATSTVTKYMKGEKNGG